ncbi:hypothetical protein Csa_023525, partial [Cucumis sativus]
QPSSEKPHTSSSSETPGRELRPSGSELRKRARARRFLQRVSGTTASAHSVSAF